MEQFRLLAGFVPTEENLARQIWDDPDYEPDLVSGAFVDGNLVGFCIAVRRPWKRGREDTGYIKWIYVSPELRRQTIGSQLLRRTESVMQSHGVTELIYGSSAPLYLWPGVAEQDFATQALLNKHGWSRGSERINLTLTLPTTISLIPATVTEIETRLIASADRNNLKEFITAEFSQSWWQEIEAIFQPEQKAFGVIACREDQIIGFAATHATNSNWFGPMGVRHSERGKGIGRQLLLKSVREATVRGSKLLTIPWVNEEFYNKCLGKLTRQVFVKYSKCV